MMVSPVQSATPKGIRIIDAISVILADQRLVVLEEVWHDLETVKQYVSITRDARSLRHDDRADSLAWALQAAAPMLLADESDWLPTRARQKLDELLTLPIRKGGIREDGIEAAMFEADEVVEHYQWRLDRALEIQAEELRAGKVDAGYAKYIDSLQAELKKLRR